MSCTKVLGAPHSLQGALPTGCIAAVNATVTEVLGGGAPHSLQGALPRNVLQQAVNATDDYHCSVHLRKLNSF